MKVLTLHQPWASLIALGVKTIETRSWRAPESLIGQRFAIHAAAKLAKVGPVGEYTVQGHGSIGGRYLARYPYGSPVERWPLPLGCIVATAVLDDCVPMVGLPAYVSVPQESSREADAPYLALPPVYVAVGVDALWLVENGRRYTLQKPSPLTDQLPYGDFQPGRWAWLLRDVEPVTEKCPACRGSSVRVYGMNRLAHRRVDTACRRCGSIRGGRVDPIPFKGGQGLSREWTP